MIILVILLVTGCNRSVTPQRYVHKALAIMDRTALFAEGPSWDGVLRFKQRNRRYSNLTAGYASANRTFDMGDGSKLVITSSCDVARTGEVFCDDSIDPDCLTDVPMDAALEWLRIASL